MQKIKKKKKQNQDKNNGKLCDTKKKTEQGSIINEKNRYQTKDVRPKISNEIKQTNPETNYYDPTTASSPIPSYHVLNPSEKHLNK